MQLIDKTVECRDSQILNAERYHEVLWQRRFMAVCVALSMLSVVAFIVAVFLPDWAIIDFTNTHFEHVHIQLGVWGEWRTVNMSKIPEWTSHFPEPASTKFYRLAGVYLKHYHRAQAAFSIIAIALMIFANCMALYSFTHHRYMFKRLVAFLYLITGMCILMNIEILVNSVDEWRVEVAQHAQHVSDWDYAAARQTGTAVYMAWAVVIVLWMSAAAFAYGSHKQKGSRAATAEFEIEDRPIYVGRD